MKKSIPLILSILLSGCSSSISSPSLNSNNSSSLENITSTSNEATTSSSQKVINKSSSKGGNGLSVNIGSKTSSKGGNNSTSIDPNALSYNDVLDIFALSYKHDEETTDVSFVKYNILRDSYTKQEYTSKRYDNDITISIGEATARPDISVADKIVSNFIEEIVYEDKTIYTIKKYDSSFVNQAHMTPWSESETLFPLSLGQGIYAYQVFEDISKKQNLIFDSKITDYGFYISLSYYEEMDENGYCDAGGIELKIDENYYIQDFYYTEGQYDYMYVDDISTMRRHGPAPYGYGGITYEAKNIIYGDYQFYDKDLPFPISENFVKNISFKQDRLEISKDNNYIDLYNYVITDPIGGERNGCPYNNLVFTSSNSSVAAVDGHYLDFKKVGETTITVKDSLTKATSSNTLTIIVK